MVSDRWSEIETQLALFLYFQLPYGKLHKGNPEIQKLASHLGRTPSSVAMKLGNFASLDPVITDTGRKGLKGASKLDRMVFEQFSADWTKLASEAEAAWSDISSQQIPSAFKDVAQPYKFAAYEGVASAKATIERRVGQNFFRKAVLANYDERCCVTGIADDRLLNASHIKPWSIDEENRHNPANGIALSATFDRAYDRGLMTIRTDGIICISGQLLSCASDKTRSYFSRFHQKSIELPKRFPLAESFLRWHQTEVFRP